MTPTKLPEFVCEALEEATADIDKRGDLLCFLRSVLREAQSGGFEASAVKCKMLFRWAAADEEGK